MITKAEIAQAVRKSFVGYRERDLKTRPILRNGCVTVVWVDFVFNNFFNQCVFYVVDSYVF